MATKYFAKKGNKRSGGGPHHMKGSYGTGKSPIKGLLGKILNPASMLTGKGGALSKLRK